MWHQCETGLLALLMLIDCSGGYRHAEGCAGRNDQLNRFLSSSGRSDTCTFRSSAFQQGDG